MLLPLDEVPVHVHPFAAHAPCDSKGSQCQCGIHTAEAASALRSRKTERAAKEKPTPISHIFFITFFARHPNCLPRRPRVPFPPPPSPPPPLAIRKAPSARVESIEPRPPRPCEVGRPKGRRRKNRRQSHPFFFSTCCAWHTNSPPRPGEAPHPAPSARKSVIRLHRKLPSLPPASTQEVSESENRPATRGTAHSEV